MIPFSVGTLVSPIAEVLPDALNKFLHIVPLARFSQQPTHRTSDLAMLIGQGLHLVLKRLDLFPHEARMLVCLIPAYVVWHIDDSVFASLWWVANATMAWCRSLLQFTLSTIRLKQSSKALPWAAQSA